MIQLGFNLVLAWVAVFSCLAAAAIWGLRYTEKWDNAFGRLSKVLRRRLRKQHITLGVIALISGLIHGLLSSDTVWSLNLGTITWVATIFLGLSFMLRKRLSQWKNWMKVHRALTVALAGLIVVHIINVGGITIHEYAYEVAQEIGIVQPANTTAAAENKLTNDVTNTDLSSESQSGGSSETATVDQNTAVDQVNSNDSEVGSASEGTQTGSLSAESPNYLANSTAKNTSSTDPSVTGSKITSQTASNGNSTSSTTKSSTSTANTNTSNVSGSSTSVTSSVPSTSSTESSSNSQPGSGNGFMGGHGGRTAPSTTGIVKGPFKDGVYTGTADGYRPGLQVEVTVKNNQITQVRIVSHNEHGERFYGPPMEIVPEEIVASQSTDVDTVSGATFTSVGIINAVNEALKNAGL